MFGFFFVWGLLANQRWSNRLVSNDVYSRGTWCDSGCEHLSDAEMRAVLQLGSATGLQTAEAASTGP